jgi:hypothetical protein
MLAGEARSFAVVLTRMPGEAEQLSDTRQFVLCLRPISFQDVLMGSLGCISRPRFGVPDFDFPDRSRCPRRKALMAKSGLSFGVLLALLPMKAGQ